MVISFLSTIEYRCLFHSNYVFWLQITIPVHNFIEQETSQAVQCKYKKQCYSAIIYYHGMKLCFQSNTKYNYILVNKIFVFVLQYNDVSKWNFLFFNSPSNFKFIHLNTNTIRNTNTFSSNHCNHQSQTPPHQSPLLLSWAGEEVL